MCMQLKKNPTSLDGDLFVTKHFYSKKDLHISGNLYIGEDATFYAGNVEADNIYIICNEKHLPYVDALSLRAHGGIFCNCFDELNVCEIVALDGPAILKNDFYAG